MNTKQLWNALCLSPITNKYFDGIFSSDTLKEITEKPFVIQIHLTNQENIGFYSSLEKTVLIFLIH